jgi:hypothetical protein
MVDDRPIQLVRKRLAATDYLVTALEIESASRMSEKLSIADYHRHTLLLNR